MKNTMKILLCMMLALAMALSFAACGEEEAPAGGVTEAPNEAKSETAAPVADAVEGFMQAVVSLDSAEMSKYVDGELPEELKQADLKVIMEGMGEDFGASTGEFEALIKKIVAAAISYEVKSVEEDGDTAVAKIALSIKDTTALENIDFDAMLADPAMEEKLMGLIEDGTITEESSEEELMSAIFDLVLPVMEEAMLDALENVDVSVEEYEIPLVLKDGEWKISEDGGFSGSVLDTLNGVSAF